MPLLLWLSPELMPVPAAATRAADSWSSPCLWAGLPWCSLLPGALTLEMRCPMRCALRLVARALPMETALVLAFSLAREWCPAHCCLILPVVLQD